MAFKRIFIDSNIILDLLLQREPFVKYSQILFAGSVPSIELCTSALVLANVHYLTQKHTNKKLAKAFIKEMLGLVSIFPFESGHIISAVNNEHTDFEDNVQYFIAKQHNCDLIITRNIKHYKNFDIPVLTAEQFLRRVL